MRTQFLFFFFVLAAAFLSVGTVVKKKDPILETQTGPVGYSEKAKEETEGKKGPPAPALTLFPKERFLVEGPVEKGEEIATAKPAKEEAEAEFWLEEEGEENGEEFKLEAERDDSRKTAKGTPTGLS